MEEKSDIEIKYLTIKGRGDGFGAQYQAIMSGIALCEFEKYKYFHTPFVSIQHLHSDEIEKMNEFIGIKNEIYDDVTLQKIQENLRVVMEFEDAHYHCKNPSIYYSDKVLKQIRFWYFSTEKPKFDNVDIAIHIRRGDVHSGWAERYTDNNEYKKIIQSLKLKYPAYKITIVSEGNIEDFKDFELEDSCFLLNGDVTVAFHTMVTAKVLVMSKSSFSYTPAILNSNTIYYMKFWHNPLDQWLSVHELLS